MTVDIEQKRTKHLDESLTIQHDWHLCLRDPVAQFFVGIKPVGASKTEFIQIQVTKLVDEYGFSVLPGEGSVKSSEFSDVSLDQLKNLHVTFRGRTTIFVAPTSEKKCGGLRSAPRSLDFSSTGNTFVTADSSGNLTVASSSKAEILRTLEGHIMDVYRCKFFPSGLVVLSGGMDMTIRIWAVDSGVCAKTLKGHTQSVTGLGIIGVGKEILSCSNDGTAKMWKCGSGETIDSWEFKKGKCVDLAVSVDSSRFAVICENNFLSIIDLHGEKMRRDIHLSLVPSALCFSGDEAGEVIFVGFVDGHVAAYNVSDKSLIGEIITEKGSVTCLKYFRNRLLVAFTTGNVFAYQILSLPSSSEPCVVSAEFELTGADCEPVYDIAFHDKSVHTCGRDGFIRTYMFNM